MRKSTMWTLQVALTIPSSVAKVLEFAILSNGSSKVHSGEYSSKSWFFIVPSFFSISLINLSKNKKLEFLGSQPVGFGIIILENPSHPLCVASLM